MRECHGPCHIVGRLIGPRRIQWNIYERTRLRNIGRIVVKCRVHDMWSALLEPPLERHANLYITSWGLIYAITRSMCTARLTLKRAHLLECIDLLIWAWEGLARAQYMAGVTITWPNKQHGIIHHDLAGARSTVDACSRRCHPFSANRLCRVTAITTVLNQYVFLPPKTL